MGLLISMLIVAAATLADIPEKTNIAHIPLASPLEEYEISSSFGYRVHPISGKRRSLHAGVDMPSPKGTPVFATADGIITESNDRGGYGNMVEIHHGNEIVTRYAHLDRYETKIFDLVKKGDLIGYVGSTGNSTGNHLHYEIRIDDTPINPEPFLEPEIE